MPTSRVKIEIDGHRARAAGELDDVLPPLLTVAANVYDDGGNPRCDQGELFSVGDNNEYLFAAGFAPRIVAQLRAQGYDVEVVDHTQRPKCVRIREGQQHEPPLLAVESEFLHLVATEPRGQLYVRSPRQVAGLIRLLCQGLPAARVLVIVKNRAQRDQLYGRLKPALGARLLIDPGELSSTPNRVFICTALLFSVASPYSWDVLVFGDPQSALAQKSVACLEGMTGQLRYGLFPGDNRPRGQVCESLLEKHFGPPIHLGAAPLTMPDVQVSLVQMPGTPSRHELSALDRKRQWIWHNTRRNIAIAEIAEAFAAGDIGTLWRYGLLLDQQADYFEQLCRRLRVVVLVEVPEHGRMLLRRLQGWRLYDQVPRPPIPGPQHVEIDWGRESSDRFILTMIEAAQHRCRADVVIRADGTASPWYPDYGPDFRAPATQQPLQLVDFADQFDSMAVRQTDTRRRDYHRFGWAPVTLSPSTPGMPTRHGYPPAGKHLVTLPDGPPNPGMVQDTAGLVIPADRPPSALGARRIP
jgi:hypothetical protein